MSRIRDAARVLLGRPLRRSHMRPLHGSRTSAGVSISPEQSLQVTAVLASVRLISEAISGLPVNLFIRDGNRRLSPPAPYQDLVRLLKVAPNPVIDAAEFWRTVVAWMLIRGNSYVYVQRDTAGRVIALWPIAPTMVDVLRTPLGMLAYRLRPDQKTTWLPVEYGHIATHLEILHYRWFGTGPEGLSPIGVAREQVGISVAASAYIGGFFDRDATPESIVSIDGTLTDAQYQRLQEQLEERHRGFDKSHEIAIFEGGAKIERTSLSPADAQFLQIYKLTRTEIASIYGVPPHKIGDLDRATFSNIEQQSIEFVQEALLPSITRLEHVTRRLFDDPEMRIRFDPKGRMRGDTAAQTASYAVGRQWGYYSANDVRTMEDLEPIDGGDEYLVPLNMLPAAPQTVQRDGQTPLLIPQLQAGSYRTVRSSTRPASEQAPALVTTVHDVLTAHMHTIRDDTLNALQARSLPAGLDRADWDAALAAALADPFRRIVTQFGQDQAADLGGTFDPSKITHWVAAAAARQGRNINTTILDELDAALTNLDDATPAEAVTGVFNGALLRSLAVAVGIVNAIGAFGRHEGASQAGAVMKTWIVNSADPRPTHAALNGSTIPVDEAFANGCMWPGDVHGGVDEIAGCTCGISYTF